MKKKITGLNFIIILLLLTACSPNSNTTEEAEQSVSQEEMAERNENSSTSELSEEEQRELELIQSLPKDVDAGAWNLILVNSDHPLPEDFNVETEEVDDGQRVDSRIVENWNDWKEAAVENGHSLYLVSGYRTVDHQEWNFNNQLETYIAEGDSEEEAYEKTARYYAVPGHSEHHTGLAIDILDSDWIAQGRTLEEEYETQESQQWLEETMTEYGFILRYPEDKEDITGIGYEPWHFRYVGEENAEFITEHNLVLEEYIALLNKRDDLEITEEIDQE